MAALLGSGAEYSPSHLLWPGIGVGLGALPKAEALKKSPHPRLFSSGPSTCSGRTSNIVRSRPNGYVEGNGGRRWLDRARGWWCERHCQQAGELQAGRLCDTGNALSAMWSRNTMRAGIPSSRGETVIALAQTFLGEQQVHSFVPLSATRQAVDVQKFHARGCTATRVEKRDVFCLGVPYWRLQAQARRLQAASG